MRKQVLFLSVAIAVVALASAALAQNSEVNPLPRHFPTKGRFVKEFARGGGAGNLVNHGGPVIHAAHVVPIYWGPSWGTSASPSATASSLTSYIAQFGTSSHYAVITQYYDSAGNIQTSNLGNTALFDSSNPPTNVTDADIQNEVLFMTNNNPQSDTIYEVFLPSSSYSSSGTSTSCGGPNLKYCAYHGNFSNLGVDVKYASMPYPSCGGCQSSGFSTAQNFEHFISHETREAVTDEDGNAWYDRRGYEADDKCAWSPAPFIDGNTGYAYQYEWSNSASACVK